MRRQPPALKPRAAEHHAARLEDLGAKAASYIERSKAKNTRRAYRADWQGFTSWCGKFRRSSLPASPDTVAYYLADRSQSLKTSTLQRRLATIAEAHRAVQHLVQLRRYIAKDNPKAASKVANRILEAIQILVSMPHAGRPGRVPETRELVIADTPFIVAYRVAGNELEIIAVLHSAQKWPRNN